MSRVWLFGVAVSVVLIAPVKAQQVGDTVPESALRGPAYSLPPPAPPPMMPVMPHRWRPGDDVSEAYVMALQHALPTHGYPAGAPTGRLDPETQRGILEYQADARLPPDITNVASLKRTLDHITFFRPAIMHQAGNAPPQAVPPANPPTAATSAPIPLAPAAPDGQADPATIRLVQQRLKAKGYDITVSGTLDVYTVNAIKVFQASNGLPRDGKIDQYLLDLLKK